MVQPKIGKGLTRNMLLFFIVNCSKINNIMTERIAQGEAPRRLVGAGSTSKQRLSHYRDKEWWIHLLLWLSHSHLFLLFSFLSVFWRSDSTFSKLIRLDLPPSWTAIFGVRSLLVAASTPQQPVNKSDRWTCFYPFTAFHLLSPRCFIRCQF